MTSGNYAGTPSVRITHALIAYVSHHAEIVRERC
jgi:hypothetical protein